MHAALTSTMPRSPARRHYARQHDDIKGHLDHDGTSGDLAVGVHVAEPDGGQGRQGEVQRIGLPSASRSAPPRSVRTARAPAPAAAPAPHTGGTGSAACHPEARPCRRPGRFAPRSPHPWRTRTRPNIAGTRGPPGRRTTTPSAIGQLKAAQQSGDFAAQGQALAALDAGVQRYQQVQPAAPRSGPGSQRDAVDNLRNPRFRRNSPRGVYHFPYILLRPDVGRETTRTRHRTARATSRAVVLQPGANGGEQAAAPDQQLIRNYCDIPPAAGGNSQPASYTRRRPIAIALVFIGVEVGQHRHSGPVDGG